ncbi:MAG: dual specificity protein phosphatase [Anaerolineae bacterium]|nr:dual specificity protein phosphatase [Anaerolineae bacterium]
MFQIRDWLYVSGFPIASDKATVKKYDIDAMLQLFQPIKMQGVESLYLKVEDGHAISMETIQEGIGFVLKQHKKGRRILVSCGAGVSRSVTFATAALKEVEGISLEEAYRSVHSRHKEALPDHIHWESMREYYGEGIEFWEIWQSIMLDDNDEF